MIENINTTQSVLIIRVDKLYYEGIGEIELYEITRGVWKVGCKKSSVNYVFSVYKGVVKEIYKVNLWRPARIDSYQTRTRDDIILKGKGEISLDNRYEFLGKIAEQEIREKYLNISIAYLFKQGAANPIRYVTWDQLTDHSS